MNMEQSEIPERHSRGMLSITSPGELLPYDPQDCDVGVQVADDGRLWVCVNGQALVRFKPHRAGEVKDPEISPFPDHIRQRLDWIERNMAFLPLFRDIGYKLTDLERRALGVLVHLGQPYNLPLIGDWRECQGRIDGALAPGLPEFEGDDESEFDLKRRPPIELCGRYVIARINGELATYDADHMTALVLAAHRYSVRVSVNAEMYEYVDTDAYIERWDGKGYVQTAEHPRGPAVCMTIMFHPREPSVPGLPMPSRHPSLDEAVRTRMP